MTDPQQAARIAAMRARRGQQPVDLGTGATASTTRAIAPIWAPPAGAATAPAARDKEQGKHPHVAAGARIIVTGLTASAVFGITTVIAAANRPIVPATDSQVANAQGTATTIEPASTIEAAPVTPAPTTVPPSVIVLTLPPTTVAAAVPAPAAATPVPAPKPATAPAPAASPAPVQTAAPAPMTTQPPAPAATTKTSK